MSTKVKRKVTVENNKDNADQHRRPSVFERLGPGAVNVGNTQQERHSRAETQEKCRNWLRNGSCVFGTSCRYQHDPFPNSSSRRNKSEKHSVKKRAESVKKKEIPEKDLRHKVRSKRDDNKESRTRSLSPKRKGSKRSGSRSRKGEHESKIKSTVVVTRPRSPAAKNAEPPEREKKKIDGAWEDDSDDWPLDSTQLDYKEELTLERKRQQLQRELELEYQKERMMNENVTITKTVSFSESSSSSSSSESGSISTTSDSSSSSSDDDSDDSSSSSSSSSSSASRPPKKKIRKPASGKDTEMSADSSLHQKPRDDYDKIKSSRAAKIGIPSRSPIPSPEPPKTAKKGRDRRNTTPPPPSPKHTRFSQEPSGSGRVKSRVKGPHTPSPPHSRKQRQWEQSSSADSRSADARQARAKRHKKKRDAPRNDAYKSERAPTPPPQLSSPNRTALVPNVQFTKKSQQKVDDLGPKSRQRNRDSPPLLLSRMSGHSNSPSARVTSGHGHHSLERDRSTEPLMDRSKLHMRKPPDDNLSQPKRSDSREQMPKRSRFSPRRDGYRDTLSPPRGKLDGDGFLGGNSRKPYSSPVLHLDKGDDRNDRRRRSPSPGRGGKDPRDRRNFPGEFDKKRELREPSPRPGRDNLHRNVDSRNYPRKDNDIVAKRGMSPDIKKGRDDKGRDRGPRDRNMEHEPLLWNEDHKKGTSSNSANRTGDGRGWQDVQQLPPNSRGDRLRDKERDRKKGKERDMPHRPVEEGEKQRMPSPIRVRSPLHGHHPIPEVDAPMSSQRGRLYEPDIPPGERGYGYGYDAHRDPLYVNDRLMPPEYEPDLLRGPPVYGSEGYPEGGRYRRDPPLKEQGSLPRGERVGGYNSRDGVSSRDMLPSRELERRNDDYLPDVPIDERHAYDERWGRNRPMREEWDPYGGLPPSHPPSSSLDEDRYGMPRRRRASPDWQLRNDDRELPMSPANHRQGNHPPLPPGQRPEQRGSRSPPPKRMGDTSRGSWGERPGRNSSRGSDNRHDLQQKNQDDRKGIRNGRRDHRDRGRRRDGGPLENKPPLTKDKPNNKRPRSPSPIPKDCKKRKEDVPPLDPVPAADKNLSLPKRPREETKLERKPPVVTPAAKTAKADPPSPKGSTNSRSSVQEKVDVSQKNPSAPAKPAAKMPEKEEKKVKRVFPVKKDTCRPEDLLKRYGMIDEKSQGDDDDFSDWSDGDDDLLNRDDFNEVDIGDDFDKTKNKGDESQDKAKKDSPDPAKSSDSNSKQTADQPESAKMKAKEPVSQPSSKDEGKEKPNEEVVSSNKEKEPVQELKEYEAIDSFMVKDETDTDDYITTECVDYDPISDDELEAMIEEPDDQTVIKHDDKNENSGIVDALDVNWSTLMSESRAKTDFVPGFARKRFKTAHVLSQIGFSQTLAGPEMTKKIFKFCQEQLDQELAEQDKDSDASSVEEKFAMEHHIAAFHVAISESKKERAGAFNNLGPNRRALCARKDLQIRKLLCQPLNKLVDQTPATYRQQSNVDKDLYKKSLELLNLRKSEYQARTVDVC